jgi:hypothetical protein
MRGRTPAEALREALGLEELPPVVLEKGEENEKDAA